MLIFEEKKASSIWAVKEKKTKTSPKKKKKKNNYPNPTSMSPWKSTGAPLTAASCMSNIASIIKSHNKNVSSKKEDQQGKAGKLCNCRKLTPCPYKVSAWLQASSTKQNLTRTTPKVYIGLTELTFKKRYYIQQSHSGSTCTALNYQGMYGNWRRSRTEEIHHRMVYHRKGTRIRQWHQHCDLCLTEKLFIQILTAHEGYGGKLLSLSPRWNSTFVYYSPRPVWPRWIVGKGWILPRVQ